MNWALCSISYLSHPLPHNELPALQFIALFVGGPIHWALCSISYLSHPLPHNELPALQFIALFVGAQFIAPVVPFYASLPLI